MIVAAVWGFGSPAAQASSSGDAKTRLVVSAWPESVFVEWAEHARSSGMEGDSLAAACKRVATGLALCLELESGGKRRLATGADLERLGGWEAISVRLKDLGEAAAADMSPAEAAAFPGAVFYSRSKSDGLDTAVIAAPEMLAGRLGPGAVLAFPDRRLSFAWVRGNPEVDKVLAVAVRKAWESADRPVSPRLYRWTGDSLREWGEARPSEVESP